MPKKGKDGFYHSKVVPGPGLKPVYFRARTLPEFYKKREEIIETYITGTKPENVSFRDAAMEWWDNIKKPRISRIGTLSTQLSCFSELLKRINPSILCRAVRYLTLQQIIDQYQGYSKSYVDTAIIMLRAICEYCVTQGYMEYNHAASLIHPQTAEPGHRTGLTLEQARQLLDAADRDEHGLLVRVLYYTGCRIGEACGLQWGDIDWDRRRLHIQRSLASAASITSEQLVGKTKSDAGIRWVPIPAPLMEELRANRGLPDVPIVQPGARSRCRYMTPASAARAFGRIARAAGMEGITAHWLRHNYATGLYLAGVPLAVSMQWLGHSHYDLTVKTYAEIKKAVDGDESLDTIIRDALITTKSEQHVQAESW